MPTEMKLDVVTTLIIILFRSRKNHAIMKGSNVERDQFFCNAD